MVIMTVETIVMSWDAVSNTLLYCCVIYKVMGNRCIHAHVVYNIYIIIASAAGRRLPQYRMYDHLYKIAFNRF